MKAQHQKFAELHATGIDAGTAYATAYNVPYNRSAISSGKRLATASHIRAKITELRERAAQQSEAECVLTLIEKRKFLARVLRTPVTALDPENKSTHDLIKKVSRKMLGTGENAEEIIEVEGYDKIKAITEDTALAGDGAESEGLRALDKLLSNIPREGMITPTDEL